MVIIEFHGYELSTFRMLSGMIEGALEFSPIPSDEFLLELVDAKVRNLNSSFHPYIRIIHDGNVESVNAIVKLRELPCLRDHHVLLMLQKIQPLPK